MSTTSITHAHPSHTPDQKAFTSVESHTRPRTPRARPHRLHHPRERNKEPRGAPKENPPHPQPALPTPANLTHHTPKNKREAVRVAGLTSRRPQPPLTCVEQLLTIRLGTRPQSCTMRSDARTPDDRASSIRLDYCTAHGKRQIRRGAMGRKKLHIVEYSAPELRVPASEETRLELSPFCLSGAAAPRTYPHTSQPVSLHMPPVERIPVPVTPFPNLFRDDPEPA